MPVVPFQGDRFRLPILVPRVLPGAELFRPPRGKIQNRATSKLALRVAISWRQSKQKTLGLTPPHWCITVVIHLCKPRVLLPGEPFLRRADLSAVDGPGPRRFVASGRLAEGDLLPSVRQVAQDLQVNQMTVSKAYSLLERERVVERVRGQGMRVNHQSPRGTIKERQNELRPLLEQVATQAYQLALTREQVLAALDPLLKERGNE